MAAVNKIDSNVTGLRYAEEASIGVLGGSPVWKPMEPNSYKDFGGQITTVARNPINSGRQNKKGVTTDVDASGGFSHDLLLYLQDIFQGFFFADLRRKAEKAVSAVSSTVYTVASGGTDFPVGSVLFGSGFAVAANNGPKLVTASAATTVTVSGLAAEASPPAGSQIVRVGHQAGSGDLVMSVSGNNTLITATTLNFTTLGLIPGEWIYVGGDLVAERFATANSNGFYRVKSVTATVLTLDKGQFTPTADAGTGKTIRIYFGRVLKNEVDSAIKRRTYQLERTLGAPDDASPSQIQSEYLIGAVPSQLQFNINMASKLEAELTFVGIDYQTRTGTDGVKAGTRPALVDSAAFNSSSDFTRLKMSLATSTSPLFAFLQEMTLTVNNNVAPAKAVSVMGAFDTTQGNFDVGGSVQAYFSSVDAVAAIRANSDVTLDFSVVAYNTGFTVDIPLISLGDGRLSVEQDKPITLPLSLNAATGAKLDVNMNHTLLMVFWDYLPNVAH